MNSKRKGNTGENEIAKLLTAHGFNSHRNDQRYKSGFENPDISLPGVHIEVKRTESLRLYDALHQAVRDANGAAIPVVMHRRNRESWVVIMRFTDWIEMYKKTRGKEISNYAKTTTEKIK